MSAQSHALSFAQHALWFAERLSGPQSTNNLSWAWRLRGPLNVAALSTAIAEIVSVTKRCERGSKKSRNYPHKS